MSRGISRATIKLITITFVVLAVLSPNTIAQAQKVEAKDRDRGQVMLSAIKDSLKKNYYDPNFRGMDVDARFKTAEDKLKQANSLGQVMTIIAQALMDLDDSHTFFVPPGRQNRTKYGWNMQIIGDRCFVNWVEKGSDAEAKGVKPGDEVLQAGGYQIDRSNLWKFLYLYNSLRPQPGIRVTLRSPSGEQRQLDLMAKKIKGKAVIDTSIRSAGRPYLSEHLSAYNSAPKGKLDHG